jgi:hypothetical protein
VTMELERRRQNLGDMNIKNVGSLGGDFLA